MDRLSRWRGPLAGLALAVLTLVAAARVGLGLSEAFSVGGSRAVAAARLAPNAGDGTLTLLTGLLVASCFLAPPLPRRRPLAVWGALLTAVSVLATLVALGLSNLEVAGWGVVWLIPDLAVPVLVGAGLAVLAREPGEAHASSDRRGATVPAEVTAGPTAELTPSPPDPELEPAWSQDAAAGAVWRTAGDAARGAPAAGWGAESGGWSPAPGDSAPERRHDPGGTPRS